MLGLGRALGETMAVTFVIGNATRISDLALRARRHHRLDHRQRVPRGRPGTLKLHSLLALGFILFVISFIVLALADAARLRQRRPEPMTPIATARPLAPRRLPHVIVDAGLRA